MENRDFFCSAVWSFAGSERHRSLGDGGAANRVEFDSLREEGLEGVVLPPRKILMWDV